MQNATISVLLLASVLACVGALSAWAASRSRHYVTFRICRGISLFGYFLGSFVLSFLPFVTGLIEPSHAAEPLVAIGFIASMYLASYATKTQIRWHENRQDSEV